jgi:hypothetical protein
MRTLARLRETLDEAGGPGDPAGQLHTLARRYLAFALAERALWSALFDYRTPPAKEAPDWYLAEHAALIERVEAPLAGLAPGLGADRLSMRALTLFLAVHGIIKLSLEDRFVQMSEAAIGPALRDVAGLAVAGLRAEA